MKYSKMNLGQIEALINKVGGYEGVMKILSGRVGIVPMKPWQIVQLGNFQNEDALRQALDAKVGVGNKGDACNTVLKDIEVTTRVRSVDLVILAMEDLGLSDNQTMEEIYRAAAEMGLHYCPDETAAQVLLQCNVDLKGLGASELLFAMDPARRNGEGFRIRENDGKNYLTRFTNKRFYQRGGYEKIVFVRK